MIFGGFKLVSDSALFGFLAFSISSGLRSTGSGREKFRDFRERIEGRAIERRSFLRVENSAFHFVSSSEVGEKLIIGFFKKK